MFVNSFDLLSIVPKVVPVRPTADGTIRGPGASTIGKGDLGLFDGFKVALVFVTTCADFVAISRVEGLIKILNYLHWLLSNIYIIFDEFSFYRLSTKTIKAK